jgi:hypothetical protein
MWPGTTTRARCPGTWRSPSVWRSVKDNGTAECSSNQGGISSLSATSHLRGSIRRVTSALVLHSWPWTRPRRSRRRRWDCPESTLSRVDDHDDDDACPFNFQDGQRHNSKQMVTSTILLHSSRWTRPRRSRRRRWATCNARSSGSCRYGTVCIVMYAAPKSFRLRVIA